MFHLDPTLANARKTIGTAFPTVPIIITEYEFYPAGEQGTKDEARVDRERTRGACEFLSDLAYFLRQTDIETVTWNRFMNNGPNSHLGGFVSYSGKERRPIFHALQAYETMPVSARQVEIPSNAADIHALASADSRRRIAFWRDVMQTARAQGIDVYSFTWNRFLCGVEDKQIEPRQSRMLSHAQGIGWTYWRACRISLPRISRSCLPTSKAPQTRMLPTDLAKEDTDGRDFFATASSSRLKSRPGACAHDNSPAGSSALPPLMSSRWRSYPNLRYAETPGVEAKFQSLDVYSPKTEGKHPVLIFIHGGGWQGGDKSSPSVGESPARFYCGEGFVYVSINYRLTPAGKRPANIEDVAKAVAWVHDNIEGYGGDPKQMSIMGHSAGGHLTALVATDEKRLMAEGKSLSILKRAALLDPAAYDIPRYMKVFAPAARSMRRLYESVFGTDPSTWADASPQQHIATGKSISPMLMFYTGACMDADKTAPAFAAALTEAGAPSRAVDTVTLSHADILRTAAQKGQPLADMVLRFLRGEDATTMLAPFSESRRTEEQAPLL
ncbi:MAG: alpha/beta hydrolase [Candidatus Sumerlaeota bacterium]|nr:alpha/beta hydrolase [Candidatus Sumerlaeota bacterium]